MPAPTHLLWCDLETTGVDEELDGIIEIGCILTDTGLNELGRYHSLVWPEEERELGRMLKNKTVYRMHREYGLLDELVLGNRGSADGPLPPGMIGNRVVEWMRTFEVLPHRAILAGSGVSHFDKRFIKWHMHNLYQFLGHPTYDVGVIRRALQMAGITVPPFNEGKNHRAQVDIECHLEEGRWQRWFWEVGFALMTADEGAWVPFKSWCQMRGWDR